MAREIPKIPLNNCLLTIAISIILVLLFSLSSSESLAQMQDETIQDYVNFSGIVEEFVTDEFGNRFVVIWIDSIQDYSRNPSSDFQMLLANTTNTYGFLWGHKEINETLPILEAGRRITGEVGYHSRFTSHTGHLYYYDLVCNPDERKEGIMCVPLQCPDDQVMVGYKCVPLNCPSDQEPKAGKCVPLNCQPDEQAVKNRCVPLECRDDEHAVDNECVKLECRDNEMILDHVCVKVTCSLFRVPHNHGCAIDFKQVGLFTLLAMLFVSIVYELIISKIFSDKRNVQKVFGSWLFLIVVLVISLSILVFSPAIRSFNGADPLAGGTSFIIAQDSRDILSGNTIVLPTDILFDAYLFYSLVVAYFGSVVGIEFAVIAFPIILGVLSAGLFYLILRAVLDNTSEQTIVTLLLITSPGFIGLFTLSGPDALMAFLLLAAVLLQLTGRQPFIIFSALILAFISMHGIFLFFISAMLLLFIMISLRSFRKTRFAIFLAFVLGLLLYHLLLNPGISDLERNPTNFVGTLTDLGAMEGYGLFFFALGIVGFVSTWKHKNKYWQIYLFIGLLLLFVNISGINQNYYLNFFVAYLAGLGMIAIIKHKWQMESLKTLIIIMLICGLFFSTLSYSKRIIDSEPTKDTTSGLEWLRLFPDGGVMSYESYSPFIEYYANKRAVQGSTLKDSGPDMRNLTSTAFNTRNLVMAENALNSSNTKYILITSQMKSGLVWEKENQGLLFLLRSNETFKRIYANQHVEIWEYLRR